MNAEQAAYVARDIIDANQYLVLATADATGRPWCSPVYYAHVSYRELYWVSLPDVAHSRNIASRPEVGIAIFDSHARIGTGQGVYMSALASQVPDAEIASAIATFSARSTAHGGLEWKASDVTGDAELRLYRATAEQHWILAKDGQPDHRMPLDISR